jgi:hypothetical protein
MLRLSVILMLIGLGSALGVSPYLGRLYATTRPTAADPASGRVYVHHVRGGTDVYVTQAEHLAAFGSFAGGTLLAVLGGFLFERSRRKAGGGAA